MNEADEQYQTGMDLKAQGQLDQALTWFRRAAISDPKMVKAHLEIGRLCKQKSKLDPMFQRYAFDAFRLAAQLDLNLQEAHDQYIIMAQQMGILHQVHPEYENLAKQNPNNEVLQRCYKNIVAISMAIFSPQTTAGKTQASGSIKKLVLVISIFTILVGAALIFLPPMFTKQGKINKEQARSFFFPGLVFCVMGVGGIIYHRRLH